MSYEKEFSDPNYPGKYPIVGTSTYVMDGNDTWQIISESDEHVFEKYSYDISKTINSFSTAALSFPPVVISPTYDTSYKVYFDELPNWASINIDNILNSASNYWGERDRVTFERVYDENKSNFLVQWTKNYGHPTLGYNYADLIDVGLGSDDCIGAWQPYSEQSVSDTLTHELGHAIGYGHSDNLSDIMYPDSPISYQYEQYLENSIIGYTKVFPVCTNENGVTYNFQLNSDTNHRYDIFYVPSITEYEKFLEGENYRSTCMKTNITTTNGSCKTNLGGHFVVYVSDGNINELATYEFVISETNLPVTETNFPVTETFLPPIRINENPPSKEIIETITTNQEFFQVHSNEFTTISISGFVPEEVFSGQYPVYLSITFGGKVISELKVPTTANGYFNTPFQLPLNSPEGTYLISGKNMGNSIGSTTFTLGSSKIIIPPSVIQYDITLDQTEQESPPSDSFTYYSSSKNGFSIVYPEKWIYEEDYECLQEVPCMFSLADDNDYWTVEVNVNFWKNEFENYSFSTDEQYLNDLTDISNDECINSLEYYGTECSNYDLIYAKTRTIDGITAYEIHYSWKETYNDGTYENFVTTFTEIPQGDDLWQIYSETLQEYENYNSRLIEKTVDSLKIQNVYAEEIPVKEVEETSPKVQCGKGTVLKNGKCELVVKSTNLNTQLYYNNDYSFSVEYPKGWNVDDSNDLVNVGVYFMDGIEATYYGLGQWNTAIGISFIDDVGEQLSDSEEKQWQLDNQRETCGSLGFDIDGLRCSDFNLIEQTSGLTSDGYTIITTIYRVTNNYPDYVQNFPMVSTVSYIYIGNDIWEIFSESDVDIYNEHQKLIQNTINSFKLPATPPETTTVSLPQIEETEPKGGGCLIATATYGSELAPQVQQLRELRDNQLLNTESGASFMESFNDFYYSFSPAIADYERENPVFKEMVKIAITPMITSLSILNYVNMDSEVEVLGYGISLIILNGLMYVGIPASVIVVIRNRNKI